MSDAKPDRFEAMARELVRALGPLHEAPLVRALRQVATKEALRVLDELETGGMGFDPEQEEALARLRARITKGEF